MAARATTKETSARPRAPRKTAATKTAVKGKVSADEASARVRGVRRMFSCEEAGVMLGVNYRTVKRLVQTGAIKSVTIGSRRLIRDEEIERVMREGTPS